MADAAVPADDVDSNGWFLSMHCFTKYSARLLEV